MNPTSTHKPWLDSIRGFAAVSISLFHFNAEIPTNSTAWSDVLGSGYFRVPIFFTLSGWGVTSVWLRSMSCREFGTRRLRRLLPPYYASLVLVLIIALGTKLCFGTNDISWLPATLPEIIATLTLTTTPVSAVPTMNWVYWALSVILSFYLVLAVLRLVPDMEKRLAALAFVHFGFCAAAAWVGDSARPQLNMLQHWPIFGVGIGLAVLGTSRRWASVVLLTSVAHAVFTIVGSRPVGPLAAALSTALLIFVTGKLPFPRLLAPLRWLGVISYSIYLVHVPAARFLSHHVFLGMRTYVGLQLIFAQLLGLVLVILLAWGFHRACESMLRSPARATRS